MIDKPNPSTTSSDYNEMVADWEKVQAIRGGITEVRKAGVKYLPQYGDEHPDDYARRLSSAPWRPEFEDALLSICSKPFTKEVGLADEQAVPEAVRDLTENIDGRGNNLHVFARAVFADAVSLGLVGIYVTFPAIEPGLTRAQEREVGARPYWVPYVATDILALYTRMVGEREVVEHIRLRADETDRDGFKEVTHKRVRVLEHFEGGLPTSTLWELNTAGDEWIAGETSVLEGMTEIPFVLLFTGKRSGHHRVKPPLSDLAEMQMELYRAGARKDEVQTYVGFPMLKALGMEKPQDEKPVKVGPSRVLYAGPSVTGAATDWQYLQPDAANLKELREDINDLITEFRRLAMQPTTARSGVLTATGEAIQGAKAHSAIEAWASGLKDALEQAFVYTSQWLGQPTEVEVFVHTDFLAEVSGAQEAGELLKARTAGEISRETYWDEMKRRGFLGPQFDPEEEAERLEQEAPALGMMGQEDGQPVENEPKEDKPERQPMSIPITIQMPGGRKKSSRHQG
jgi:hypothetical protein